MYVWDEGLFIQAIGVGRGRGDGDLRWVRA